MNRTFVMFKAQLHFHTLLVCESAMQNVIGRKLLFCLERLFSLPLQQFSKTPFSPLKTTEIHQTHTEFFFFLIRVKIWEFIHELSSSPHHVLKLNGDIQRLFPHQCGRSTRPPDSWKQERRSGQCARRSPHAYDIDPWPVCKKGLASGCDWAYVSIRAAWGEAFSAAKGKSAPGQSIGSMFRPGW